MCSWKYVYIYIHLYGCLYAWTHTHMYIYISTNTICLNIDKYTYGCPCIAVYYIYVIYIYICVVCVYIYIHSVCKYVSYVFFMCTSICTFQGVPISPDFKILRFVGGNFTPSLVGFSGGWGCILGIPGNTWGYANTSKPPTLSTNQSLVNLYI